MELVVDVGDCFGSEKQDKTALAELKIASAAELPRNDPY